MATASETRRTPNDLAALCVELLRAVREQEFCNGRRGGHAPSVDRAWRAWRGDLDRHGPLDLHCDARGLHEGVDGPPIRRSRLDELQRRLAERGLSAVRFEPGLDAPTYGALVALLVADPRSIAEHGGPAGFLPEQGVGIRLPSGDADDEDGEKTEPDIAVHTAPPQAHPAGEEEAGPLHHAAAPEASLEAAGPEASTLERLERCEDLAAYPALAAQAVTEAIQASESGDADAWHHAVIVLSKHAGAGGDRSDERRMAALGALGDLCTGPRLTDLLERATSPDRALNLRASQILLQLAGPVAPALLSAIDVQTAQAKREELVGLTIALGRAATPALRRAMEGSSASRARTAARIAGEIRDERAVPTLARLLAHADSDVRGESARALARIGDPTALDALSAGLDSPHEEVSALCAYCLGVTGREEAGRALTETLRQARRKRRIGLASAVIRSLGRLGREESVPELRRILTKRSFFRKQELHELKLQAVAALAKLPGDDAREALLAVAAGPDMSLAVAARRAVQSQDPGDA